MYPTAPLPVPLAPLSTLIHESFDDAVHAQLLSDGVTVTLPEPPPETAVALVGSIEYAHDTAVNVAVTLFPESIVTVHVPVPLQPPPLQPVNVDPEFAVAVNVTEVPKEYDSEQLLPQSIPDGELVTLPEPVPATEITKLPNDPDCPARTGQA
ncbi:hypothetical protein MCHI_003780 [Candidatus Magnetoovum chiemensis]|nr:hypothetical protein MCHI_003780 [Candidatus Magnetoovum chiemensis]